MSHLPLLASYFSLVLALLRPIIIKFATCLQAPYPFTPKIMEESAAKFLWDKIMQGIRLQKGDKDMIKKAWNIMLSNEERLLKSELEYFKKELKGCREVKETMNNIAKEPSGRVKKLRNLKETAEFLGNKVAVESVRRILIESKKNLKTKLEELKAVVHLKSRF